MSERYAVIGLETTDPYGIAMARNWFETQAAQFRQAGALIAEQGGDVERMRELAGAPAGPFVDTVEAKALDALKLAAANRRLTDLRDTDIHRQQVKNAAMATLGKRATNAMVQADRREREHLAGSS